MIFRNSIKSILRTPLKTVLFLFLIAAVTSFLYLGVNTWTTSAAMLRDCETNYSTIVTIEYLEDYGSNKGSKSDAMLADVAAIDFDAIAANENVILWQPSDVSMGLPTEFVYNDRNSDYSNDCVFIVTGLRQYAPGSPYHGKLVESLYSARPYEVGRGVFIENEPGDYGFVPDPDATYVILAKNKRTSANGLSVEISPFYSWIAEQEGVDCTAIAPFQQIESAEALHADENDIYLTIAKYYEAMNNSLLICRARDLGDLEEFNQNHLWPVSGRLFTKEEGNEGAKVCVISETLAQSGGLKVGDVLNIQLPDDENAAIYAWGDKLSRRESFTIVGIVNYNADHHRNVYTPPASHSTRPVRFLYDLGQASIKNGTAEEFISSIKPLLPERTFIAVYDQGYRAAADALKVIRNAAISLSAVALAVTLTVLAFFAYLFTDRQRDAVEIMRCFGAKKAETRLYLMAGASIILFIAISTGILAGTGYAERVIKTAYEFVSELQAVDMRYSNGFRGIVKKFSPVVTLSYTLIFIVGVGVLIIALALCLYYAERTINGRLISARAGIHVRRPPKKSSVALSGALRYAILFIKRSSIRSILTPTLCAAALLFVSSLQATLASYDKAKDALYENTELNGYCAQMNGKFSDKLTINNKHAQKLATLQYLDEIVFTYSLSYNYLGITKHADGSEGQVKPVPYPKDPYELEILTSNLSSAPSIVFTDAVRNAPEFYFEELHARFMPGWDEARFSDRQWERLPCIVSAQFMNEHGIRPGDMIRVYVNDYFTGYRPFIGIDMLVAGSFTRVASQNNIYCPLPLGALDPENSTLNDLPYVQAPVSTGRYARAAFNNPRFSSTDSFTQQQVLDVILDNKYVSALTFKLREPRVLSQVKDILEKEGFSGPTMPNDIRVCVVIEDSQFNETLSSIVQRSKYLEMIYPILLSLVCILGLITGFLAVNSRREDIALMRGMGTQKRRIFATIFGEQVLLLIIGALPAAAVWFAREGSEQLSTPGAYAFFICYAISAALSALLQNSRNALSILSDKE